MARLPYIYIYIYSSSSQKTGFPLARNTYSTSLYSVSRPRKAEFPLARNPCSTILYCIPRPEKLNRPCQKPIFYNSVLHSWSQKTAFPLLLPSWSRQHLGPPQNSRIQSLSMGSKIQYFSKQPFKNHILPTPGCLYIHTYTHTYVFIHIHTYIYYICTHF